MRTRSTRAAAAAAGLLLCLAAGARAADRVVLFDEGHGQRFLAGGSGDLQLSGLAELMRAEGLQVRTTRGRLGAGTLAGVSAVVVSGAFSPLAKDEVEALHAFVTGGGRLAVMLHVGQPLLPLLGAMGIQFSRGPVHDPEGSIGPAGTDFAVTRFARHPLTEGIGRAAFFGAFGLLTTNASVTALAHTGPRAWLDSDGNGVLSPGEPVGAATVALAGVEGRGEYAVFGDDALFQNRFLREHNRELGRRLARWLARGAPATAPRRGVTDL